MGYFVNSEKFLQRLIQMTAHMRLLYKLGGYPDRAHLWSKKIEILTDPGLLNCSGLAQGVADITIRI
jgi:hypothetical protein